MNKTLRTNLNLLVESLKEVTKSKPPRGCNVHDIYIWTGKNSIAHQAIEVLEEILDMGVMPCYRTNCDNIMCDKYSSEHGYICDECFEELVNSGLTDVAYFMRTPKKSEIKPSLREYYNDIFIDKRRQADE